MQKIIISGNLGKDAQSKELEGRRFCVSFGVAVNSYKGKGDERKQLTQWYSVSYFVNNEAIVQYLKTGAKVVVCGSLDLDTYRSEKTGNVHVNASVLATDVEIVGFVEPEVKNEAASSQSAGLPPLPDEDPFS